MNTVLQLNPRYLTDPCTTNPCKNNGGCLNYFGEAECICVNDFTGDKCEIPPEGNDYISSLIHNLNNHKCEYTITAVVRSFILITGYVDPCQPNPCENNGICSNKNGDAECNCVDGFTGLACEIQPPGDRVYFMAFLL